MRKAKRGLFLTLAATMLLSANAYGAAPFGELTIHPVEHPVSVSSVSYKEDIVHADPRGEILSTGIVAISDNGDGTFYVSIETYAHENADRIKQTLYLEIWDEGRDDWVYVDDWEFATTKEENGGELYEYVVEMNIDGCEVGESYRVRGSHMVRVGTKTESFSSMTDGVTLTD